MFELAGSLERSNERGEMCTVLLHALLVTKADWLIIRPRMEVGELKFLRRHDICPTRCPRRWCCGSSRCPTCCPPTCRPAALGVFQDGPVEDVVVLETTAHKEVPEELSKVAVVRLVLKAQRTNVDEVGHKLLRKTFAEYLRRCRHLLFTDLLVFLFLVRSSQTLPRQTTPNEIHEDVTQCLQIVSPALLDSEMGIHTRVTSSSRQVFVFTIRNVLMGLRVAVLLGETEVDDVDLICLLAKSHEKIIWLDISVDETLGVDVLHSAKHLVSKHQHSLQAELPGAKIKQILETWPQQINDHNIVVTLDSIPTHCRKTHSTGEDLQDFRFVQQLRMPTLYTLQLYRNLFACCDRSSQEDVSKRATADFPA
mmetsp:Transcript_25048/g.57679  ORF Transcript_25048/g.57679 Transcript_25048/m.57679 type:complete len:367 (+) Transcript_25048:66-1166(+)